MIQKPYEIRERQRIDLSGESRTKQSFKDASDINNILAKYQKTGLIDHARAGGFYEDLPAELDYHSAMNMVLEAQNSFDGLPSSIRREFNNDPRAFLSFIENPSNVERMAELGLLNDPLSAPETDAEPAPDGAAGSAPADPQE